MAIEIALELSEEIGDQRMKVSRGDPGTDVRKEPT
jgi:hypothetical protein